MATPNKTKAFAEGILTDFDAGCSIRDLSDKYDVSEGSMRIFLKKNDRVLRGRTDLKQCKTLSIVDAAYIAGLVDGEGCLSSYIAKCRNSKIVYYRLTIGMSDESVISWLKEVTEIGVIYSQKRKNQTAWKDLHRFESTGQQLIGLLEQITPYLRVKRTQAELILELGKLKKGMFGRQFTKLDREQERQIEICNELQRLNRRGVQLNEAL
ncbi:LAGLIDADG family homing endonuclease [Tolypothrix sp. NIES-4075]|uniref:LAGLIDADG family homing endonuclease n=1 Tax=Tolypothrix sp. NIES-4075 TaxID=2005459 RepID=UPI000B5CD6C4|nr:LAGLIDADG family homing endonuclease [Tolypothrix sp. NIES-4075]